MGALIERPALRVVKLADGATDNWTYLSDTLPFGDECLDFYHAGDHLGDALAAAYGEGTPRYRERFTVTRHQHRDLPGRLGKIQQGAIDFGLRLREVGKILQVRGLLFDLLPQVFNRIEIRGVRQQLLNGQARRMRLEEGFHRLAGVIASPILNHHDMAPYYQTLLAEMRCHFDQVEQALVALEDVKDLIDETKERWWEAETYRLKGELLLQLPSSNSTEAETCFHHALDIARHQQAKSPKLRAATSLARLWQRQGKREEARQLLAKVYDWFTEGFDTADLQEAKRLLEDLET